MDPSRGAPNPAQALTQRVDADAKSFLPCSPHASSEEEPTAGRLRGVPAAEIRSPARRGIIGNRRPLATAKQRFTLRLNSVHL